MPEIKEGNILFSFPDDSFSSKYDDWSFYRNQFIKISTGVKAVDIISIKNQVTWLIEVKDYRDSPRTKSIDLAFEVALKIKDTLAGLAAARVNANDTNEKELAHAALNSSKIRIVLHLEQNLNYPTRARSTWIDPANLLLKLKQILKSVDPHPLVLNSKNLAQSIHWTVQT